MNLKQEFDADAFNEPATTDETATPAFPSYQRPAQGVPAQSPLKNSLAVRKVKIRSADLAAAISKSKRARPGTYRFGR
jgi:hypothetical protein